MAEIGTVDTCLAALHLQGPGKLPRAEELRGYLGYAFLKDAEFHHHMDKPYHYPLVQYKVLHGTLSLLGLQAYAGTVAKKAGNVHEIITPAGRKTVQSAEITRQHHTVTSERTAYRFLTPWLALNEKNYTAYKRMNKADRKKKLEQILTGNILSAMKGLGVFVPHSLGVALTKTKPEKAVVHGNPFLSFHASFEADISLPDFIGLGKSVSKGYGTLEALS